MDASRAGYPVTTASAAASAAWDGVLEAMLAHAASTPDRLAEALAADPGFALAHATRGLMLMGLARREFLAVARDCLACAEAAAQAAPPRAEERAVIEALALWLADAPRHAAERLEASLAGNPRDVLALKLSQMIRFMLGHSPEMLVASRLATRDLDHRQPLAGFVLGCHAFALEERGLYAEAERAGREAVMLAPRDIWGRHAVAHVMEMTGRIRDGIAWLEAPQAWAHANNLRFHVAWHMALFRLEQGETGAVLALYDREIRGEQTGDFRDIANGASLLARLELAGIDVGRRWEELAWHAEQRLDDRCLVFADLHYILALLGAGRGENVERIIAHLMADEAGHADPDHRRAAACGVVAAQGLLAFRQGRYGEAAEALGKAVQWQTSLGGSHAQRDIFEQAHLESLMRAGEHARAETLLRRRLLRRGGANRFAARRLQRLAITPMQRNAARLVGLAAAMPAH